ncbi:Pentatricopeptide repeat-containing protein At1g26900, mitochondrial [Linum grandiflorum]
MLAIQRSSRSTPKFQIWFNHHNPKPHSIISASENLATLLQSCNQISEIVQVHGFMVKTGLQQDPFSVSKLLASSIRDARYAASIFENIRHPNLFMFNSMLRAYSISETPGKAFSIFRDLRTRSILLDRFSFVTTLKACARELAVETGRMIHGVVVRSGHLVFVEVKNALLHFYGVCGETYLARKLFDEMPDNNDLVSWNILMAVSLPDMAMGLFKEMSRRGEGVSEATLLTFLSSFGGSEYSLGGKSIHGYCIKTGWSSKVNVVTALVEMYTKTGSLDSGRRVFDGNIARDVVLWNCMIDKYAKAGLIDEGIALLMLMKDEQVKPNSSTLASLLSSCAANGSIKLGKYLSTFVEEEAMTLDAVLGTALIDMFAKSGFLNKAIDIFDRMVSKDVKSWTAMILSYGIHGRSRDALALFYRMEEERFVPNEVTFLALLSACSHGGMVAEAMDCFRRMVGRYGLVPMVEHYGCITDLLGRAGLLKEARGLIESLPIKNDATAWRALLAACRVHGDVELGEKATRVLVEMGDRHPTDSMLLLSSYAVAGRLEDRWSSQETGVKHKEVGCSMIEVENS